ncbi:hypothetical protein B0G57_10314 [Trinickia symbiotica]|nr:DUF1016 domain-containing protein [Trinickia symbiotica]PPK45990.1 hypothetical protein B0G57_10314 [Trinickia symbiotica]
MNAVEPASRYLKQCKFHRWQFLLELGAGFTFVAQ